MNPRTILIVDDEAEMLEVLSKKLSAEGYQVINARTGKEAIEKAKIYLPDIILMDIVLPDMEGSDAIKTLQADPQTESIPSIFLSGIITRDEGDQPSEINVGGRLYNAIGKPFSFDELLSEIETHVGD